MKQTMISLALCTCATGALAATVTPTSYDMVNGGSGGYTYHDETYNGTGNTSVDYAQLSGGTGDLTDGVIAGNNWPIDNLKYVGWRNTNPSITFNFAQSYAFNSVTVYFDDSNGSGGVMPPASIAALGQTLAIDDLASGTPYSVTMSLGGTTTDQIVLDITRKNQWIMVSEVTFDAEVAPVPVPASGLLMLAALGGLAARRRR